jgi:hypothetical protein
MTTIASKGSLLRNAPGFCIDRSAILLRYGQSVAAHVGGNSMREKEPSIPGKRGGSLFELGQVVGTLGALQALADAGQHPAEFLARHVTGDWGDLCDEDKEENELSVEQGFRILSAYKLQSGAKVWVITEADRSATTILLPDEY